MKKLLSLTALALLFSHSSAVAQTTPTAFETQVGEACTNAAHSTDFDTLVQCSSTDGTAGTLQKAPLFIGAVTAPPYADTTCDAAKEGMIQYTGTEVQICDGTSWGSLAGTSPSGGQSMVAGWPDAIVCLRDNGASMPFFVSYFNTGTGTVIYRRVISTSDDSLTYNRATGAYTGSSGTVNHDCVTNAWSISDLISNGKAFNLTNGGGGVNEVPVGTAGAPGLYFTGDENTGVYRPAADTVAIASAGVEIARFDSAGALSFGQSDATTGSSLDLSSKTNSIIVPKGTTAQQPTGVEGMIRYNTETNSFEGYSGSTPAWQAIGGSSSGSGGQSITEGWPDVITCHGGYVFYHWKTSDGASHRYVLASDTTNFYLLYNADGSYNSNGGLNTSWPCVGSAYSMSYLIANGYAFNIVNGGGGVNEVPIGTAGAPGLYFTGDTNTGIYRPAADTVAIATNGVEKFRITAAGKIGLGASDPTAGATIDASSHTDSIIVPKGTTAQQPTGVEGMIRYNTETNSFEGYSGSTPEWTSLGSGSGASGGQSMLEGWPDIIVCDNGTNKHFIKIHYVSATVVRYLDEYTTGWRYIEYNPSTGAYSAHMNLGAFDCVTSTKSIATLVAEGNAFNLTNGGGGVNEVPVGTAGAPGLYFTGDTNTGIYRPAADTVAIASAGVEIARFDSAGALSFGQSDATTGSVIDASSKTTSIIVPKGTTAQQPTGVEGMIRYNTETNSFEGYSGSTPEWTSLGSGSGASGSAGPSFHVHRNGTNQTIAQATAVLINWTTESFDTNNNFDLSSDRYTPTVAGKYIFSLTARCYGTQNATCVAYIYKNGAEVAAGRVGNDSLGYGAATATVVLDMNGTTDYVSAYVYNKEGTLLRGPFSNTYFSGALIAPAAEGSVLGTGSANYLPLWTATNTLTDSPLYATATGIAIGAASVTDGSVLDASSSTDSIIVPKGTTAQQPTGVEGMIRYNTETNSFEGYSGSTPSWTSLGSGSGASGGQSMFAGWPDAIVCNVTNPGRGEVILYASLMPYSTGSYFYRTIDVSVNYQVYYNSSGDYDGNSGITAGDCLSKSIATLNSEGRTFNFTNGGGGVNEVPVGTAGAPGLYFTGDENTGVYRPAADTVAVAVGGAEVARFDSAGALSFGQSDATTGSSFDLSSKTNSMIVPKGTTAQQPTGVEGMIRYNTETNSFEGYSGSTPSWTSLGSGSGASGGQSLFDGWPDAVICTDGTTTLTLYHNQIDASGNVTYRLISGSYYQVIYTSLGAYSSHSNMASYDCVTNVWTISEVVSNGKAFNLTNGGGGVNEVPVGTAGAPGLYFTGDTNTGIYRPAADTVAIASAGVEIARFDSAGALSFGQSDATTGSVIDASSKTTSIIVPKGTTAQQPTGVEGMIRYNTETNSFEGYSGSTPSWTSLGSGSGALGASSGPYFSVHRNDVDMTVVTNTETTLDWTTKRYDTNSAFDLSTDTYTPTVSGLYYFQTEAVCVSSSSSTESCILNFYKNGSLVFQNRDSYTTTNNKASPQISIVLEMNGTTDSVYVTIQNTTGTTIRGWTIGTVFEGALIAPAAEGSVLGTGSANYLPLWTATNTLTDSPLYATATSIAIGAASVTDGSVLDASSSTDSIIVPKGTTAQQPTGVEGMIRYNTETNSFEGYSGSTPAWTELGSASGSGSGQSMYADFPDAIMCDSSGVQHYFIHWEKAVSGKHTYLLAHPTTTIAVLYNADGSYSSNTNASTRDCVTNAWSISDVVSNGRAFNFVNGGGGVNEVPVGTAGAPGLYFTGDENTGVYRPAADTVAVAVGGSEVMRVSSTGVDMNGNDLSFGYERVSKTCSAVQVCNIACPSGKNVLSGGCTLATSWSMIQSWPASDTQWNCYRGNATGNITAYAICANVK